MVSRKSSDTFSIHLGERTVAYEPYHHLGPLCRLLYVHKYETCTHVYIVTYINGLDWTYLTDSALIVVSSDCSIKMYYKYAFNEFFVKGEVQKSVAICHCIDEFVHVSRISWCCCLAHRHLSELRLSKKTVDNEHFRCLFY